MARRVPWRHFPAARYDCEAYVDLSEAGALLYHRLYMICDRHGRGSILPAVAWTAARFRTKQIFEDALAELSGPSVGLVLVFLCVDEGVRCFEIVDYDVGAPAELLRRRRTPSEWQPPPNAGNRRQSPATAVSRRQPPANVSQAPETTPRPPARSSERALDQRSEMRDRDQAIADNRTHSPANAPQVPETTRSHRDGADAFAAHWGTDDDRDHVRELDASQSVKDWLTAVKEARERVGRALTATKAFRMAEAVEALSCDYSGKVIERALAEHVKLRKGLAQSGDTPIRFLRRLCEQQLEADVVPAAPAKPRIGGLEPKQETWQPPPGMTREDVYAEIEEQKRATSNIE